jgi:transcriptional regulator with XRE-family HTH domain
MIHANDLFLFTQRLLYGHAMPLISPAQLRAARGLLNWSRADLAKQTGISEATLYRFESGTHEPEVRTANKLLAAFNEHHVEFSERQGVRFKLNEVDIYEGKEQFDAFYDFLYEHLSKFGGEVCLQIYDELLLGKLRKDPILHVRRMKKLCDQKKITSFRILTTISDYDTCGYTEIRLLPDQSKTTTAFYAFGDCLALLSFIDKESPYVVVLRSHALAEGYRQNFNIVWKLGKKPPFTIASKS